MIRVMMPGSIIEKTLAELLAEFRVTASSDSDKGSKFERLTKFYLIKDPIWSEQLANVRLREEAGIGPDVGIDLVADDIASGGKVAIQCKFYDERTYLDDLGTFYTSSGKDGYVRRIIVTTSNQWTRNAEEALKNQQIPVQRILLNDMEQSLISWGSFDLAENYGSVPIAQKELRPHQVDALTAVIDGFKDADRGKVIMACGTGKTLVSLRIAEEFFKSKKTPVAVLFLAPSISLLSQTIMEWGQNKKFQYLALAVCSDAKVGKKDDDDMQINDLAIPASTDVEKLVAALKNRSTKNLVIFSTYQSLEIITNAQQLKKNPLSEFDLVVCDEAHRTTGVTTAAKAAVQDYSHFVRIHDNKYVKAKKRMYMTATPKIYKDVDNKVAEAGGVIASMDDPEKFGEEFYRLGFGTAVERDLLSDYRVLILAVDEEYVARVDLERFRSEDSTINLDDASKLLGCWRGLSKIKTQGDDVDDIPMKRAVAFTNTIDASQVLAKRLEIVGRTANRPTDGNQGLSLETRHVDGKQNALVRRQSLEWLKADPGTQTARILTNARCLSEGIDVPALDAVIFTEARGSQVDIVQAVGRVMRKYDGKNSGYIILPVAITAGADINSTLKGTKYKVIWDVLNALRAHDDRFDVIVNQINLNQDRDSKIEVDVISGEGESKISTAEEFEQGILVHLPSQIADGIYAKIVEKVGERDYWERWAKEIVDIAKSQELRVSQLVKKTGSKAQKEFKKFHKGLKDSINESVTSADAIEMLAQHLITKPIFDALFVGYGFAENNPVSKTMDSILSILSQHVENDEKLSKFYNAISKRVIGIDNNASRQKLITELYERFFKTAFPSMSQKLGIVYTPVEIVDFMLHSVEAILNREFKSSLNKKGVSILDPFTGTGTYITRLLQSALISPSEVEHKYRNEIFANEIVLLAYYIAAINIESTFSELNSKTYKPFAGIVLTDTFQMFESKDVLDLEVFTSNNSRAELQKAQNIQVIIGNPPYSVGQKDASDSNQNMSYEDLDERISKTYVNLGTSRATKKAMYDSYIRAFRWATDRIQESGIVCYITNGSWLDSNSADGFRRSLQSEFSSIYVLNLRGNQRTSGEISKKEGGKIFGSGSRTSVTITLLVKNKDNAKAKQLADIYYYDIGDYLTREEKLQELEKLHDIRGIKWNSIQPNESADWINHRDEKFASFMALADSQSKGKESKSVFRFSTKGVVTGHDARSYNFSKDYLKSKMSEMIKNFNSCVDEYPRSKQNQKNFLLNRGKSVSWVANLIKDLENGKKSKFVEEEIVLANYRPFTRLWLYQEKQMVWSRYSTPRTFPKGKENIAINITGNASSTPFSALMISQIPDFQSMNNGVNYPLYFFENSAKSVKAPSLFGAEIPESGEIHSVTDWALMQFRKAYGSRITKDDIFYYVYGILSSPEFQSRFGNDMKKTDGRIPLAKNFFVFSNAGRSLSKLHVGFDEYDYPGARVEISNSKIPVNELYKIEKMKLIEEVDLMALRYNEHITITQIPKSVLDYKVNGRAPLEWVVERFQYKKDADSGIESDPNKFSSEPQYILSLIKSLIHVSIATVKILNSLPAIEEQDVSF